ncbi:sensor domain-containing diguanylate cyclase [Magnetospirillum sp. ME-1]|uniref:sensor domain-containing diguanylate cyclase n=1 Tax=Magnetospirillum sp. ME-1 TaxID=1639348 RepID=UPI0011AE4B0F|nr:diguanylate cyclase [Magnetospirillum sp. ME-1]
MNAFRFSHLLISGAALTTLCLLIHFGVTTERGRRDQELRADVGRAALARLARLEAELNANVFLANGMVAHIVAQNGVMGDSADRALQALHQYGRHIRNIGIAPDNRISRVFPHEGNQAAIGLYYPDIPSQWPSVQRAIETRSTVLAGPVNLRQGGTGVISRTPVFFADGRYWGVISIVLDLDDILWSADLKMEERGISFALRGVDGKGANGVAFFGDERLFREDALLFDAHVPGGTWQLAAMPTTGWHGDTAALNLLEAGAIALSLALSYALFAYLRNLERLRESERRTAALINASLDAACLLAPNGTVLACNQALASRFQKIPDDLIGKCVYDFFPDPVRKNRRDAVNAVVANGRPKHFPDQRDGLFLDNSIYPITDARGTVSLVAAYSRDVTSHVTLQQRYFDKMQQLDTILACSSIGIALVKNRQQVWCNQAMSDIFGHTVEEMNGQSTRMFYPSDEAYEQLGRTAYDALLRGERYGVERQMRHKDGHLLWARMWGKLLTPDDPAGGSIWTFEDVSERKAAEAQSALAARVFHEASQGIIVTDPRGTILTVNEAFTRITGYDREEAVGQTPKLLKSNHQDQSFYQAFWRKLTEEGRFEGELWNRRKNGEAFLVWQTVSAIQDSDGKPLHYVAMFSDVTELRRDDQRIRHIAFHDALTDLPNRTLLRDRLEHALATAVRARSPVALMFLDLDGFKAVNDTLGHEIGDFVLKEVAVRMVDSVRTTDTVSRLGGDEFVVLLENPNGRDEIIEIANRIIAAINRPMVFGDKVARVGTSIGIGLFPDDADDAETLLTNADAAMYVAKKSGKNDYRFHSH